MRVVTTIALLFCFTFLMGQEKVQRISLEIQDKSVAEILSEIEQRTDFQFYYAEQWLDSIPLNKSYRNESVEVILTDLFQDTEINFFVAWDNRIVLTRNNSIYGDLPEGFLDVPGQVEEETTFQENVATGPILLEKQKDGPDKVLETIRIGRERKTNRRTRFTLSGYVTNTNTGEPIADLAIVVRERNIGSVTDNRGFYEIELPSGLNIVETSSLGVESSRRNVIIYDNGRLDFNLEENFEQLDEVVVAADATRNIEDTSTGNTRIGSEASKNVPLVLGERDVLKIATTLPGVSTAGEGSAGFNVRGGKTDQNLILLDNAVIYNPTHFFGFFQAFNPFAINDLNIYKGSIPAEFGGRLSSVFDIGSKDASDTNFKGEVSVGPVTSNAVVEIPLAQEKAGLMVGARGAYSDWILRSLDEENLNNSQASFYDFITKYNHKINDNNELRGTAYYSRDIFSITSDSLFDYSNRLFSVQWNRKLGERSSGTLMLNNSQYKFNIDFDGSTNRNFEQGFQIDETELKVILKYLLNESHTIDYGISGKLYSVLPGEIAPKSPNDIILPLTVPEEKALESALFISDNFKINEQLQLDLGLRYSFYAALGPSTQRTYQEGAPRTEANVTGSETFDNNEIFETYGGPEVRVSGRYLLNDSLSIKASFNNTYQFIHTLSNNTTVSPVDTWKLSDRNIEPQQASQFSLGIYQNIKDYELSLEGFYKRQNNIIDFKTGAQLFLNENIETEVLQGKGKAYGVELLIRKNRGKLNGWLGYTYSRSFFQLDSEFPQERVNDGEFFPSNFDKPHDLSLVLNYKLTRRFSFSGNFVYQTGRPVTFPVGNYEFNGNEFVLYSERNQFRIPDFYRLDIGFNIEGNHKKNKLAHSFWTISVYNVLGRNNPYSVFFVSQDGQIEALQSSIFTIPIPSITYNFRF
ncbi:TonB-dependent receptor [Ulvibacterium sp.]|uniref:TonB-dependent receptor n=1 Tax=Ulvibacterium sp. TaxID=2665914 RepID=UPI00262C8960|nr:TonB-dependent receptor [Ulvibacterium sp.]